MQDLVGTAELSRMFGVSRQRTYQLTSTPGFPEPEAVLEMGKIWDRAKVRKWAEAHGRRLRE